MTADPRVEALARAARVELSGEVSPELHERGRERALAAFTGRRPARRPVAAWLAAAALAAALAAGALVAWPRPPLGFTVDGAGSGAASGYVHAPRDGTGATIRFSDGSEVTFTPGSAGRVAEVGPRGARVLLEGGRAALRVVHLPGARWSVEAGPFAIAVIGTAFDVEWSAEAQRLEVRLRDGAVRVRGPLLTGGIDLRAGQTLRVAGGEIRIGEAEALSPPPPAPTEARAGPGAPEARASGAPGTERASGAPGTASAADPAPAATASAAPGAPAPQAPASAVTAAPPRVAGWPARVAAGDFRAVLADAEARGVEASLRQAPLADLVALADAARYAGRPEIARRALIAERERFPASAEARAAAFLLGRIADDAGRPAEARGFYDRYLAEAPQGAFAAEALGRKMIALRRAGDPAAAAVAAEYLRLHPTGPHAAAAREIAAP